MSAKDAALALLFWVGIGLLVYSFVTYPLASNLVGIACGLIGVLVCCVIPTAILRAISKRRRAS